MSGLFAAEWLKLRKRWMPRIILLILLLIMSLIFWAIGTTTTRSDLFFPRGLLAALLLTATFSSFLWPVLGGSWAGNEYGWGTIRLVLSRQPSRIQFAAANLGIVLLSIAIGLLAVLALAVILGVAIGEITGHGFGSFNGLHASFAGALVKCFLAVWLAVGFYATLAYAAGTLFRSASAGVGVGIGFTVAQLAVTGIFYGLGGTWKQIALHLPRQYTNELPTIAVRDVVGASFAGVQTGNLSGDTSGLEAIIGLLIYMAILALVIGTVLRRRDVTF